MSSWKRSLVVSRSKVGALGLTVVLALTACVAETSGSADGSDGKGAGIEARKIGVALSPAPDSSHGLIVQAWADAVEEESGGALTVQLYPSGSLLQGADLLFGTADGRVDAALTYSAYYPQEWPLSSIAAVPFLTEDAMAVAETFKRLSTENELVETELNGQGARPLAWFPTSATALGYEEPITSLDQFDGQRFQAGLVGAAFEAVGGVPEYVQFSELYESLDRGVLNGWVGVDFSTAIAQRLHEVTPAITQVGIGTYSNAVLVISQTVWDSLEPAAQEVLQRVSDTFPQAAADVVSQTNAVACDAVLESGGTVSVLDDGEIADWKELVGDGPLQTWRDAAIETGLSADDVEAFEQEYLADLQSFAEQSGYVDGQRECATRSQ